MYRWSESVVLYNLLIPGSCIDESLYATMKNVLVILLAVATFLVVLTAFYMRITSQISYDEELTVEAEVDMEFDGSQMGVGGSGLIDPPSRAPATPRSPIQNPVPRSLKAYIDVYGFPRAFVGYSASEKMMFLDITELNEKVGYFEVGYKTTEFGSGTHIARGKGKLYVGRAVLTLPFAEYTIKVKEEGLVVLEASGWQDTPFTKLEARE